MCSRERERRHLPPNKLTKFERERERAICRASKALFQFYLLQRFLKSNSVERKRKRARVRVGERENICVRER